jgi:hypothetical protein
MLLLFTAPELAHASLENEAAVEEGIWCAMERIGHMSEERLSA